MASQEQGMKKYQKDFIRFAMDNEVLCFGDFTLKSGRSSPYFFNSGLFNSGARIADLGRFYAAALMDAGLDFDVLYGPAYKGIPLAVTTAIALANDYDKDIAYAFNRKEQKDHGEGGQIVGSALKGRVLIIDDVISAGTSIRESIAIIRAHDARPSAVVIALDRQERGQGAQSAIEEIEQEFSIEVIPIVRLEHVIDYLAASGRMPDIIQRMHDYRARYGV
jgi:orotate phosphoribosyltransferase